MRSADVYFHHVLYGALIDMGQQQQLLALDTPHLEPYLTQVYLCGERLEKNKVQQHL